MERRRDRYGERGKIGEREGERRKFSMPLTKPHKSMGQCLDLRSLVRSPRIVEGEGQRAEGLD